MYDLLATAPPAAGDEGTRHSVPSVGRVTEISAEGKVYVDFEGNERPPIAARLIHTLDTNIRAGDMVLLVFEQGDLMRPIILGCIVQRLPARQELVAEVNVMLTDVARRPKHAKVDGQKVTLEGQDEIVLRCGKSSITLRKDGKILIKGNELVSHATGTNRVKGSSVAIN